MRTNLVALTLASAALVGCTKERPLPILAEEGVACTENCTQKAAGYRAPGTVPVPTSVAAFEYVSGSMGDAVKYEGLSNLLPKQMLVGAKFADPAYHEGGVWSRRLPVDYVGGILVDFDNDGKIDSLTIDAPRGKGQWIYRSSTFRNGMGAGGSGGYYEMGPDLSELRERKVIRGKCWAHGYYGMEARDECGDDLYLSMTPALERSLNQVWARGRR